MAHAAHTVTTSQPTRGNSAFNAQQYDASPALSDLSLRYHDSSSPLKPASAVYQLWRPSPTSLAPQPQPHASSSNPLASSSSFTQPQSRPSPSTRESPFGPPRENPFGPPESSKLNPFGGATGRTIYSSFSAPAPAPSAPRARPFAAAFDRRPASPSPPPAPVPQHSTEYKSHISASGGTAKGKSRARRTAARILLKPKAPAPRYEEEESSTSASVSEPEPEPEPTPVYTKHEDEEPGSASPSLSAPQSLSTPFSPAPTQTQTQTPHLQTYERVSLPYRPSSSHSSLPARFSPRKAHKRKRLPSPTYSTALSTKPLPALDLSPVVPVLDTGRLEREAADEESDCEHDHDEEEREEYDQATGMGIGLDLDLGTSYDAREWRRISRSWPDSELIRVETSSLPPAKRARITGAASAAGMGVSRAEAAMIFKATQASLGEGLRRRTRTRRAVEDAKRRILGVEGGRGVRGKGKGKEVEAKVKVTVKAKAKAKAKVDVKGKGKMKEVEVKEETPVPANTGISTRRSTRLNAGIEGETPPPFSTPLSLYSSAITSLTRLLQ